MARVASMSPPTSQHPHRFKAEADMLAPLAASATTFAAQAHVLFEIPCTAGIPDIVLIQPNKKAIADRPNVSPLIELVETRIILAMGKIRTPTIKVWGTDELVSHAGVSAAHLRRVVLPRMLEGGHIIKRANGWSPTYRYRSLARSVVTIEAKLRDWRGGLAQASRHTAVSDAAWVAIDAHNAGAPGNHPEWFSMYGVGLATVSTTGQVKKILAPAANQTRQPERELLVERAFDIYSRGSVSGPLPKVFGQILSPSIGADPRLVGVEAC